jgi:hypothetical protein
MDSPGKRTRCRGCRAVVPALDGPTDPYFGASPGCWAIYGEVLAREYGEYDYPPVHRMTLDSYALQHPGRPTRKSIQSVAIHLTSLYYMLERGLDAEQTTAAMRRLIPKQLEFHWLEPPPNFGPFTVLDVHETGDLMGHSRTVRLWGESVWEAWAQHHETVGRWASAID